MLLHILGRQPALGVAELEARYGSAKVQPLNGAALVQNSDPALFSQLGGSVKIAQVLTELPTTNWDKLVEHIETRLPAYLAQMPEGKLKLGLSIYGLNVRPARINAAGLELKKLIKASGRSVRLVPNQESALSSAQVLHNKLTGELGLELILFIDGQRTFIAQTLHVQDIEAYAFRDRSRPMRDAKVGMLPPKLAQIIINLAGGPSQASANNPNPVLLDPFCGTGVVLLEAALMGFSVYGTDLDERMVRYSRDNLNWLEEKSQSKFAWFLERGDATSFTWRQPVHVVAAETYLGTPLKELPARQKLDEIVAECDVLHRHFFKNLASQLAPGTRLCLAVPAWRTGNDFRHLSVVDELEALGYNRIDFTHVRLSELVYHRQDQTVARELLVLTRK